MSYLSDFKEFDGGYVTFGGGAIGGRITGKETLKTGKLDFEDVYFVKELQFNLFSVSQMCDKKNNVLFTDTACFVLSPDFKLPDKSQNKVYGDILESVSGDRGVMGEPGRVSPTVRFVKVKIASIGFKDPDYPNKVYKVVKALHGLHQALRACQDKYVTEILRKFGFTDIRAASTLMDTEKPLLKDSDGDDVDVHLYRLMIGSLMYLTSSRPDIMFTYPRNSFFDMVAYSDSNYAGASLDRKSTTGGCQFLGCRLISWQCKKQTVVATSFTEAEYVVAASCYRISTARHIEYLDIKIPQSSSPPEKVGDEAVHKELGDGMKRAATTASSLEAEQDSEQFWQTASTSTLENGDIEITATIDGKVKVVSEASIRRHLKLEDSNGINTLPTTEIFEQRALMGAPSTSKPPTSPPSMQITHMVEEATNMPHDSPLLGGHTSGSDEDSMTLNELMVLCTQLSTKVESLEADLKQTKKVCGNAYTKLIMKVKKLEHKVKSSKSRKRAKIMISDNEDYQEDPSKQWRKIAQIDEDEGITLFTAPEEDYTAERDISTANVPVSITGPEVSTASPKVRTDAESLVYIRRSATKRKDKGKAIMKEDEPIQKKTKLQLEQERLGLEETLRLQEQIDEKERQRIARVQEKASTFNTEEWDNIQAQIEADEELALRLQAQEREGYSEPDKARLLVELINERKIKFADKICPSKSLTKKEQAHESSSTKDLHVELKRLFEPDTDDLLELQRYMHDPLTWRLYDTCGVHHVSTETGLDIFMIVEKDYPMTKGFPMLIELNTAKDLRLPEEDNDCMKIKTYEEICLGVLDFKAVGFLRDTSVVVVILVKGHALPTIVKV
ncbi:hypothetical protein Tco_1294987 [Tanacetum coccineum]